MTEVMKFYDVGARTRATPFRVASLQPWKSKTSCGLVFNLCSLLRLEDQIAENHLLRLIDEHLRSLFPSECRTNCHEQALLVQIQRRNIGTL